MNSKKRKRNLEHDSDGETWTNYNKLKKGCSQSQNTSKSRTSKSPVAASSARASKCPVAMSSSRALKSPATVPSSCAQKSPAGKKKSFKSPGKDSLKQPTLVDMWTPTKKTVREKLKTLNLSQTVIEITSSSEPSIPQATSTPIPSLYGRHKVKQICDDKDVDQLSYNSHSGQKSASDTSGFVEAARPTKSANCTNCQAKTICTNSIGINTELSVPTIIPSTTTLSNVSNKDAWRDLLTKMRSNKNNYSVPSISSESSSSSTEEVRRCPFYKKIPDTSFAVDAFNYGTIPGITAYFLSHFHSDHYVGLTRRWNKPLFCSEITANLIKLKIQLSSPNIVRVLPLNEPRVINGVEVTLLEANHCPGSVMFLFKLTSGEVHLHVGDFRADPSMESYPQFWNNDITTLFLDTTYCNPNYDFMRQSEILEQVADFVQKHVEKFPKTIIACGTYLIGKERVFVTAAEKLDCKIWAADSKRRIFQCLNDDSINNRFTHNQQKAQVHVLSMNDIKVTSLRAHLQKTGQQFTHILGLKPTGWTQASGGMFDTVRSGNVTICGFPYSEHSSYSELKRFVQFLRPTKVIPTVNTRDARVRQTVNEWLKSK